MKKKKTNSLIIQNIYSLVKPPTWTMRLSAASAMLSTMWLASMRSASAFAPRTSRAAFGVSRTASSLSSPRVKTSVDMANVLKLSDPQSQLLDQVDVFIFDCDGVIWRVRLL